MMGVGELARGFCGEMARQILFATVMAAAAALAVAATRRGGTAALRHGIWTAAALQFLLPYALVAGLGEALASLLPRLAVPVELLPDFSVLTRYAGGAGVTAQEPGTAIYIFLVLAWAAVALAVLLHSAGRWRAASRLGTRPPGVAELADVRRAAERLGFSGDIQVGIMTAGGTPAVAGLLRSRLLLPEGFRKDLDGSEFEPVLMHELAHVRRRDNLTAAAARIAVALFWFHPLVWWLERRALAEREFAADEMVVAKGVAAARYASAILKACRSCYAGGSVEAAAVSGSDLKKRMERIMSNDYGSSISRQARTLVCGLAALIIGAPLAAGLVSGMRLTAQEPGKHEGSEMVRVEVVPSNGVPAPHAEALAALSALFSWRAPAVPDSPYGKWLVEDVPYLITPEERKEFLALDGDAARENFIARFWHRHGGLAFKTEHYRRIARANSRFGAGALSGWRTDRGRLYIVMGPPDEIESHPAKGIETWAYHSFDGTPDRLHVTFNTLPRAR